MIGLPAFSHSSKEVTVSVGVLSTNAPVITMPKNSRPAMMRATFSVLCIVNRIA